MRRVVLLSTLLVVSMSWPSVALAQEWKEFKSTEDKFIGLFPGEPVLTKVPYKSEYGAALEAHVYTAKQRAGTYTLTVVDYRPVEAQLTEKQKQCTEGDERCNGLTAYSGAGYWKQDVRGAMLYTLFQMLKRPNVKVTQLNWNYFNCNACVEVTQVQLADEVNKTRTHALIAMHEFRLYLLEATVPVLYPAPEIFTAGLKVYDWDMTDPTYEGIYFHGPRLDPYEKYARGKVPPTRGLGR